MMGYVVLIGVYSLLFVISIESTAHVVIKQRSSRTIDTQYGQVRGVLVELPVRPPSTLPDVEGYFGLQYGNLRDDKLRFMTPKSYVQSWHHEIKNTERYSEPCPQKRFNERELRKIYPNGKIESIRKLYEFINNTREDCLHLNIYVPSKDKPNRWNDTTPMPVMVFVHGESYDIGTGNAYDGSVLASYGDVIVVTVNYRLGVLGFLSTGDANASGNYALLDLLAVLQWLKQNIRAFGGDVSRITLFGHGHGAALVNILLLSPLMKNRRFFQRAILQSGSAASSWALSVEPKTCALLFASRVNCSNFVNDTQGLVTCLRDTKSASQLVNNVPLSPKYYTCFAPTPTRDHNIFPASIDELLRDRETTFAQGEVMFGVTKNEAYSYMKQHELERGISEDRKKQIIRTYVQNLYRHHRQKIFEILDHHYTEWDRTQNDSTRLESIMQLLSDGQYVAPLIKMAQAHAKSADTYFYSFAYSTKSEKYPEWSSGVHGDELPYVFGAPLVNGIAPFPSNYTQRERKLSEAVMRMWTNFAKTGNPNPLSSHGRFSNLEWPKYNLDSQQYLHIDVDNDGNRPKIEHHYRGKDLSVWLDLIPKINKPDYVPPGSKPDPSRDQLDNAKNMTSFDEFQRLLSRFHIMFPSPPPIPPMTPPMNDASDDTTKDISGSDLIDYRRNRSDVTFRPGDDEVTDDVKAGDLTAGGSGGAPQGQAQDVSLSRSSVPLSITVAVGCSLLFINILIFAAVYYQRGRIKKLKESESLNSEETRMGVHKDGPKPPETTSLMTSPEHNQLSPIKFVNAKPPDIQGNYLNSNNKMYDPSAVGYSYSAVPTNSSSPMHRTKQSHSQANSTTSSNSKKSVHSLSNSRPPEIRRIDSASDNGSRNNIYTNDKYNQITSKDHQSSSNNAITIV